MKRESKKIRFLGLLETLLVSVSLLISSQPVVWATDAINLRNNVIGQGGASAGAIGTITSGQNSGDPMQPRSGTTTHLPIDSTYKYDYQPIHSPDYPWTGKGLNQRCNFGAQDKEPCNAGLECVEESQGYKWGDAPKRCHYLSVDCLSGDLSPKAKCQADCAGDQACLVGCLTKSDKCSYESDCLYSYLVPVEGTTSPIIQPCSSHTQCSSGYCEEMKSLQGKVVNGQSLPNDLRVCMPFSKCSYPCAEAGQVLQQGGQQCCSGLSPVQETILGQPVPVTTCRNLAIYVPEPPEEVAYSINWNQTTGAGTCATKIFEKNNGQPVKKLLAGGQLSSETDYEIAPTKYFSFNRYMMALEWLWGKARNHENGERANKWTFFGFNKAAKDLGELIATERLRIFNDHVKNIKELEEKKAELLVQDKNFNAAYSDDIKQMGAAAAGLVAYQILAEEHQKISLIHQSKKFMYTQLLMPNIHLDRLAKWNANPNDQLLGNDPAYPMYERYGSRKGVFYCEAWPPHCWLSENTCGTYLQKNKECVNQVWHVGGANAVIQTNANILIDPIYPAELLNGGTSTTHFSPSQQQEKTWESLQQQARLFANWMIQETYGLLLSQARAMDEETETVLVGLAFGALAPSMFVVLGIGALVSFLFGQWKPNEYHWYDNKMEQLYQVIHTAISAYGSSVVNPIDQSMKAYYDKNQIKVYSDLVTKDEIKLKMKQINPALTDEQLTLIVNEVTSEEMHKLGLQLIAELAQIQLLSYSFRSDGKKQYLDNRAARAKDLINMAKYLEMYHEMATRMHQDIGNCLLQKTQQLETQYGTHFSSIGKGGASVPPAAAIPTPGQANPVTTQSSESCTNGNCEASALAGPGFGQQGNMNINSDLATGETQSGTMAGEDLSSKSLSGSAGLNNQGLSSMARKQAEQNKRFQDFVKNNPGLSQDERASDRLLRELSSVDGAEAFVKKLDAIRGNKGSLIATLANFQPLADPSQEKKPEGGDGAANESESKKVLDSKSTSNNNRINLAGGPRSQGGSSGQSSSSGADNSSANGVDETLLRNAKRDDTDLKANPNDSLWNIVTKAYLRYGIPRLFEKN